LVECGEGERRLKRGTGDLGGGLGGLGDSLLYRGKGEGVRLLKLGEPSLSHLLISHRSRDADLEFSPEGGVFASL
jgi:hypothetical protein